MAKGKVGKKEKNKTSVVDIEENDEIYEELGIDGDIKLKISDVDYWISTGSLILDAKTTNCYKNSEGEFLGGIHSGAKVLIAGESATGKSVLAAQILRNAQKMGAVCMLVDSERSTNIEFYKKIGVDFSKLSYHCENVAEKIFELIEKLVVVIKESKNPKRLAVVVWDSLASTTTLAEQEEEYSDVSYGSLAKAISRGLRKINSVLKDNNITLIMTNQLRANMDKKNPYSDPFIEPCGNAPIFYSDIRFRLLKSKKIENVEKQQTGSLLKVKFLKNRFGPPPGECEIPLYYSRGFDNDVAIFNFLKELKYVVTRTDDVTIKLPGKDVEKIKMSEWRKWLAEHYLDIREIILKAIYIDLDEDPFSSSSSVNDMVSINLKEMADSLEEESETKKE